ncbi:DNA-binding NarL/FixJ family response regulator [Nocardioides sp. J9]|nr:DNA-binding NarL/FixJ family response regulator [Nocardioides sp. J9]
MTAALAHATTRRARALGTLALGVARVLAGTGGRAELRAAVPLLAEEPGLAVDPRGSSWLMYAPLFIRDVGTGHELRKRVTEARDRAGVGAMPGLLFQVSRDGATSDGWRRAAADYTEAIRLARDTGQTAELAMCLAGLAWLEARTGRAEECRAHAGEARRLARSRDIRAAEVWCLLALGDLALAAPDPGAALVSLREAEELQSQHEMADPDISPVPELVAALVRLGRTEEAGLLVPPHLAAADAEGQPWAAARARRASAMVADDFDDLFAEALVLHRDTPDLFEAARTELAYGERLRRTGRRVDAREHLRAALAVFADLGAEPWADLAATELDLTGERVPERALGGVAALTPQELQVALLLSDGRTTREAAAALFLSPKTVEYHLRKVYTKLGVRSRAELAAAVADA